MIPLKGQHVFKIEHSYKHITQIKTVQNYKEKQNY